MVNIPEASDWRDGFLFVGNNPALDFVNTCPIQDGHRQELLPDFAAVLRWFGAAELLSQRQISKLRNWEGSACGRKVAEALRALREALREDVIAWEHGSSVPESSLDELNDLLASHPMLMRVKTEGKTVTTELWFQARQPEALFAPIAHSAAMLFANADRERVRQCGSCVLHFYDTSKKGTRRWCSMRLCGNRLKVAAYAARQRRRAKT